MSNKYRKKPIVIDAVLLENNYNSIYYALEFVFSIGMETSVPLANKTIEDVRNANGIKIETLEGTMLATFGDYIIKGINGEFYPCKADIFTKTYEKLDNE